MRQGTLLASVRRLIFPVTVMIKLFFEGEHSCFFATHGVLEDRVNRLVETLNPKDRTHDLNILCASWHTGMILGGIVGSALDDQLQWHLKW